MDNIWLLRTLAEQQQFSALKLACEESLVATHEPRILPLLALAYAHLGQREVAQERLRQALASKQQLDTDGLADLAAVHMVFAQYDLASKQLQSIFNQDPDHALALARMGLCQMALNAPESACDYFTQSGSLEPHRVAVFTNLAALRLQLDQPLLAQQSIDQGYQALELSRNRLPESLIAQHGNRLGTLQLQYWCRQQAFAEADAWLAAKQLDGDEQNSVFWLTTYATLLAEQDCHSQAEEVLHGGLKRHPNNISLMLQLSELAQLQGRLPQAYSMIRQALQQDDQNPALWIKLSTVCLLQSVPQSRKAAQQALALVEALEESEEYTKARIDALQLQAKHAQAQVESQAQNFDSAELLYREVLASDPHFLPALQGLGLQQMQRGQIAEAIALFEQIKAIDPIAGYGSLINARQFPNDETTLEKMDIAARKPSLEGAVRAGILFQLAAAWDTRKEYGKAFGYAQEANALNTRFLSYDARVHRNQCARIRYSFCKALYQHRKGYGVDATLPVFVLGMPRSGTTLVEQIVAGHSQIFGAGELGVIPRLIQGLNRWERHVGSGRFYPDCVDDLTADVAEGIANGILAELSQLAAEDKPGALHVVDKMPHNFENIGLIKFLFPKARIISVRRDPRDIAISNYFTDYQAKHGGMGFAYDLTSIGDQLADHNLLMQHWQQTFPGEILEIHYEDVVDDLEGSARKLIDYIGVEWEDSVLAFNALGRPVRTASVWQVRQPIYSSSKAKWIRYQSYLAPLIAATNAKIEWDTIAMISLPEPGLLQTGVALFREGKLDDAEMSFKKMLHHNPEHAACNYMLGLVYCCKGYVKDAIAMLEKALKRCPWQTEWCESLIQAYQVSGDHDQAEKLKADPRYRRTVEQGALLDQGSASQWPLPTTSMLSSNLQ